MNTSKYFRPSWALLGVASIVFLSACNRDTPSPNAVASSGTPAPASTASADTSQANLIETIYVPGPDDKLHPKPVSFKSIEVPATALQEIVSSAPQWFPKNAKINNVLVSDKQITVDVDKKFAEQSFWGERGEKTTELGVYSLVNSASGKSKKPVQITVDKEPMSTLGDFDASDAIEPRPELIVDKPLKPQTPEPSPSATKAVPTPVEPSTPASTTKPKS